MDKVAILIDGAFFLKRFRANEKRNPHISDMQPFIDSIMKQINALEKCSCVNRFLRAYYYDCRPFGEKKIGVDGRVIDFAKSGQHRAATTFQTGLKLFPQLILRLGELSFDGWKVDVKNPKQYIPDFKQKSVDMEIGLDIAWMSGKHTVDKIVLVAGDSDFVAPMKFARHEGILVYLYPMGQNNIKSILKEHADFILA